MSENDRFCPRDCPKRELGCHASCERYKERCAENEKRKAYLRSESDADGYKSDVREKIQRRLRKDKRPRPKAE